MRRLLDLDNGDSQYQDIRLVVDRLFSFRDSFAHPKALQETIEDNVESDLAPIPTIAWENEISAPQVESDYQQIENYCLYMLDAAADLLESTQHAGWHAAQEKYPHLVDLNFEAACLRGFLHSSSNSAY